MQLNWLQKEASALSESFPEKMVLFDCETTGGSAKYHRIIEVGLIVIENGEIVETWQSFCDPEASQRPYRDSAELLKIFCRVSRETLLNLYRNSTETLCTETLQRVAAESSRRDSMRLC